MIPPPAHKETTNTAAQIYMERHHLGPKGEIEN